MLTRVQLPERFKSVYSEFPTLGLSLDLRRLNFPDNFFTDIQLAVASLPAALHGFIIDQLPAGAKPCDSVIRPYDDKDSPAIGLTLTWFYIGNDKDDKDTVVLPYKGRFNNFFVAFIVAGKYRIGEPCLAENRITSNVFFHGFYLGIRQALHEKFREFVTLTLKYVCRFSECQLSC
jgi:hypothetical protein